MATSDDTPGAVVDEPVARALLHAAVREGLVDGDPRIGDGFVRHLLSTPPSEHLVHDALEHLIIAGKIIVPFWLPQEWKGELFDRGLVVPTESASEDELIEAPSLSPDLALAMLRDRGVEWTHEELLNRYQAFLDAYRNWETAGKGKSFEGIEIRMALRNIIPLEDDDFQPEELAAWNSVQKCYRELRPLLQSHEAYRRVLTASLRMSALSALPILDSTTSPMDFSLIEGSEAQIILLRVTCNQLRRFPTGATLKETIDLSESTEAGALRLKLSEWTEAIRTNDADPVAVILADLERARKELKTAKTLQRLGEYSTIIGVPTTVVSLFVAGPLVAIGGLVVSVAGGIALGAQKTIERMNRWAMYGHQ